MIKSLYSNKYARKFLLYIPIILLTLVVITTGFYYFIDTNYYFVYSLLTSLFGFSTISLFVYGYILTKYRFCFYSKFSWIGLVYYNIINILYNFVTFPYHKIIEVSGCFVCLILSIIFLIKKR